MLHQHRKSVRVAVVGVGQNLAIRPAKLDNRVWVIRHYSVFAGGTRAASQERSGSRISTSCTSSGARLRPS